MEPVLCVQNLTKTFTRRGREPVTAIRNVSFSLYPGERLGIIGESGSGKTTLVSLAARLEDPSSGRILLDGNDITRLRGAALRQVYRKIQMVFQSPASSFDPRRTLGDGICESLRNHGVASTAAEARREAARLLERCGLSPDFAARFPAEASGGQVQRAAIARAIAVRPRVLICDEATSALDVTVQAEILDLLRALRRDTGTALLFICHDPALAQSFCDRILVLYRGEVVEEGTADQVIRRPENPYTRRLLDSVL